MSCCLLWRERERIQKVTNEIQNLSGVVSRVNVVKCDSVLLKPSGLGFCGR